LKASLDVSIEICTIDVLYPSSSDISYKEVKKSNFKNE